jgi:transmembrane sensor
MTRTRTAGKPPSDAARAEAAAWIARLHGPQRSAQLEAGLRRWLAEDPDNARAFERMTEAWEAATVVSTGHFPRFAVWQRSAPRFWRRAAVLLVVCAMGALAAYALRDPSYTTDIGEQRMVRLEDGSRISLNSASRVVIDYRESARSVRLEKGEAFFEVVSNPRRPFVVLAGNREVTAFGTSFSVRYEPNRLAVMLVEGKVTVSPIKTGKVTTERDEPHGRETADPGTVLSPGQRLILAAAHPPQLDTPRVEAVTAWRRGEVMLDKTALADAVAEMNRYDEKPLVIDDPRVASLRVSGIYRTGDSAGFARAIGKMYELTVSEDGDGIHLRERAGTRAD